MNCGHRLIFTLQLTAVCITGFSRDSVIQCPDVEATGFDVLLSSVKSVTALNFSQIPTVLYGNRSPTSWLLLLYNPFGRHSLEYANEFGRFASMAARWNHTVKIAVLNVGAPAENAWSLHHYRVRGLPALYFIPRRASWGVTEAIQLPRDPVYLEGVLMSELESRVHSLKPVPSASRVLRGTERLLYLEEAPDGCLSRRVVLDLLAVAPNVRVAWRGDVKLDPGLVRVTSYRRVRGFRYERELKARTVNSPGALAALINSALNLNGATLLVAENASSTEQQTADFTALSSTVAVLCRADAALQPPGRGDLRADALRLLSFDLTDCLTLVSTTANVWPAIIEFLRLLASAFRMADPSLSALASTLIHSGPRRAKWRGILGSDTVESDVEREKTFWRLLHAIAAVRSTRSLPSVIPIAHRLAQACPKARLPFLPPTVGGASSPEAEVLNLWWLHNQARGRIFPPPGLCPGCLPLQQERDAVRFLSNWYRAAVEAPVMAPPTRRSQSDVGLLASREDAMRVESAAGPNGRPCILQLIQDAGGEVNWLRLGLLLGIGCACCAAIILLI